MNTQTKTIALRSLLLTCATILIAAGCDGSGNVGNSPDGGSSFFSTDGTCPDGFSRELKSTGVLCVRDDGTSDDSGSRNPTINTDGGNTTSCSGPGVCPGGFACVNNVCTEVDLTSKKKIFYTSATFDGKLAARAAGDPLKAADDICNTAAAGGLLGGSYKAWLSTSTVNAIDRIADVGPWYRLDGEIAFHNRAGLAGTPLVGINYDERKNGSPFVGEHMAIWTGTVAGGTAGDTCLDWTSASDGEGGTVGVVGETDAKWTENSFAFCGDKFHLICIEQ